LIIFLVAMKMTRSMVMRKILKLGRTITLGDQDRIHGMGGNDVIYGGPGEDWLFGDGYSVKENNSALSDQNSAW